MVGQTMVAKERNVGMTTNEQSFVPFYSKAKLKI